MSPVSSVWVGGTRLRLTSALPVSWSPGRSASDGCISQSLFAHSMRARRQWRRVQRLGPSLGPTTTRRMTVESTKRKTLLPSSRMTTHCQPNVILWTTCLVCSTWLLTGWRPRCLPSHRQILQPRISPWASLLSHMGGLILVSLSPRWHPSPLTRRVSGPLH